MAALKTNRLIPVMVIGFGLLAAFVFFKASKPGRPKPIVVESGQWMRTAPTPRTSDADTSIDTIRAIQGEVTASRAKADETLEFNKQLIDKLDTVMTEKEEIVERQDTVIAKRLAIQSNENQKQFNLMMSRMGEVIERLSEVQPQNTTIYTDTLNTSEASDTRMIVPEGFGSNIRAGQFVSGEDLIDVFWIEPLDESITNRVEPNGVLPVVRSHSSTTASDVSVDDAKAVLMKPLDTYRDLVNGVAEDNGVISKTRELFANPLKKMSGSADRVMVEIGASWRAANHRQTRRTYAPEVQPYYTLPDLSILSGAVATTSLVGKIYPDGNVVDPQYFKLIVGRDNFTANFQDLPPEIEGMIFEGFGIGEYTPRCVSGRLVAATFVFEDGSTRSVYPGDPGSRPDSGKTMGYITDAYGNPCIGGELITDAAEYFATGSMLAFAGAYAEAIRESGQTIYETIDPNTGGVENRRVIVDGDVGRFARASGISEGLNRGVRWFDDMFKNSQSLIYAPSGMHVDIHLQQELRLDIASNTRKIRYRSHGKQQTTLD